MARNIKNVEMKEPDLYDLEPKLAPCRHLWQEIALGLNVDRSFIAEQQQQHGVESSTVKLSSVLQAWHDSKCSDFTWKNVRHVVDFIGLNKDQVYQNIPEGDETPKDVHAVLKALLPIANYWRPIGGRLRVGAATLQGLDGTQSNYVSLDQILVRWKESRCSEFTWKNILGVLRNEIIPPQSGVADEICKFLLEEETYEQYLKSK